MTGTPQRFSQDEWEFSQFLHHVYDIRRYLEIGVRYGEGIRRVANAMAEGGLIVGVDLKDDPYSPNHQAEITDERARAFDHISASHEAYLFLGNSREPTIAGHVARLGHYDLAFIDGDHTYEGVKYDWVTYGPMADIVAFHDINNDEWGVKRLWQELKPSFTTAEYIRGDWGIGMILRKVKRL